MNFDRRDAPEVDLARADRDCFSRAQASSRRCTCDTRVRRNREAPPRGKGQCPSPVASPRCAMTAGVCEFARSSAGKRERKATHSPRLRGLACSRRASISSSPSATETRSKVKPGRTGLVAVPWPELCTERSTISRSLGHRPGSSAGANPPRGLAKTVFGLAWPLPLGERGLGSPFLAARSAPLTGRRAAGETRCAPCRTSCVPSSTTVGPVPRALSGRGSSSMGGGIEP